MASFVINRPIVTRQPFVTVDAGLKVGEHRFQLVVEDGSGNRSRPATATVIVQRRTTFVQSPTTFTFFRRTS